MLRHLMIDVVAIVVLTYSTGALAQQHQFGTPAEARAMLVRATAAVQTDKAKALAMFNKGEGGFKDRDLQPFCFNVSDGTITASTHPSLLGTDARILKDKTGELFGEKIRKAAMEGKITEVSYMFPRPGETEPVQKVSFVTKVGDQVCGVGYFK